MGRSQKVNFLDLPVRSRNQATTLFNAIIAELKRGYSLRELGLKEGLWDNVGLSEFLSLPKKHYLKLVNGRPRRNIPAGALIRQVNELYELFEKRKSRRRVKR